MCSHSFTTISDTHVIINTNNSIIIQQNKEENVIFVLFWSPPRSFKKFFPVPLWSQATVAAHFALFVRGDLSVVHWEF